MDEVLKRHRGPYQLQIMRTKTTGKLKQEVVPLKGTVTAQDVEDEAQALLGDPRDTIVWVSVWSVREQKHLTTYRRAR